MIDILSDLWYSFIYTFIIRPTKFVVNKILDFHELLQSMLEVSTDNLMNNRSTAISLVAILVIVTIYVCLLIFCFSLITAIFIGVALLKPS